MANPVTFPGDVFVSGLLQAGSIALPASIVADSNVYAGAVGNFISSSKLEHKIYPGVSQAHGTAATTERRSIHLPEGSGTIEKVTLSSVVANIGAATITVQILKNGTNILSATLQLTNADAAFARKLGTITGGQETYVATDTLEASITATTGGGTLGQGVRVQLKCKENPS